MKFNINDEITVKLTDKGKQIYLDYWTNGVNNVAAAEMYSRHVEGDFLTGQMWQIFHIFGVHLSNGGDIPFSTTIIIKEKYLETN